jgi:hypothetical protein
MKVYPGIKFLALLFLLACEQSYRPRERAYPRFELPKPEYRLYDENHPYSFEASRFAIVYNDSDRLTEPHWINIRYPKLSAEVQITYKALNGDMKLLNEHIEDARKLINKIDQALQRIENGTYGYCDETGEPIGLGRLIARPTATLSLEAQQRRELKQKMFGD